MSRSRRPWKSRSSSNSAASSGRTPQTLVEEAGRPACSSSSQRSRQSISRSLRSIGRCLRVAIPPGKRTRRHEKNKNIYPGNSPSSRSRNSAAASSLRRRAVGMLAPSSTAISAIVQRGRIAARIPRAARPPSGGAIRCHRRPSEPSPPLPSPKRMNRHLTALPGPGRPAIGRMPTRGSRCRSRLLTETPSAGPCVRRPAAPRPARARRPRSHHAGPGHRGSSR